MIGVKSGVDNGLLDTNNPYLLFFGNKSTSQIRKVGMRKYDGAYLTIAGVSTDKIGNTLAVRFANGDVVNVSADSIRRLTDKEFDKYLRNLAKEQVSLVGKRIQELRKKRELSQERAAILANITLEELRQVEEGNDEELNVNIIVRVVESMGYSFGDLASR